MPRPHALGCPLFALGLWLGAGTVLAQAPKSAAAAKTDAGHAAPAASADAEAKLPAEHLPRVDVQLAPKSGVMAGDVVHLTLRADALVGDDVTVPAQSFTPFEVTKKRARVEPPKDGRQLFVFEIDLLAVEPGKHTLPPIELRVVTKDGFVASIKGNPVPLTIGSLLANEPNAQLKPETKPVVVMQDDFTLLYVIGAIAAAALIALLTWLGSRYLQRRVRPVPPPPPPRPAWEIAVEKLGALRRRKQRMFVDEVSDVVREYLGARFGFDGLETTTDEMLGLLRVRDANLGLWQEVAAYLARCDLVKFAKVEPDQDEADLIFAKAQDIVQFSMPLGDAYGRAAPGAATTGATPDASAGPAADGHDGQGTPR
jgi:hypothetical protein